MLGLTATPDRLDNKDVFSICDYNTVYEATLKTAIDKGWLVPFRYYGIYDESVNYDKVEYKNGKYNEKELEKALSINNRAELILKHYKKYKSTRALGFCTSKSHAEFMAKYFNENGVPSCAVYSSSEGEYNEERSIALKKLRDEDINVIFSVDMFNEGLDIKSIDMVPYGVPDPQKVYSIQLKKRTVAPLVGLTSEGILLSINTDGEEEPLPAVPKGNDAPKRLNPRDYMNQEILSAGSNAKIAELTAEEIYDIRDSRTALIKGEADNMPKDGAQLKLMLDQLTMQETALTQLFKGTVDTSTEVFTIELTPAEFTDRMVLFRFSEKLGVVDNDDLSGEPVYLSLKNMNTLPQPVVDE